MEFSHRCPTRSRSRSRPDASLSYLGLGPTRSRRMICKHLHGGPRGTVLLALRAQRRPGAGTQPLVRGPHGRVVQAGPLPTGQQQNLSRRLVGEINWFRVSRAQDPSPASRQPRRALNTRQHATDRPGRPRVHRRTPVPAHLGSHQACADPRRPARARELTRGSDTHRPGDQPGPASHRSCPGVQAHAQGTPAPGPVCPSRVTRPRMCTRTCTRTVLVALPRGAERRGRLGSGSGPWPVTGGGVPLSTLWEAGSGARGPRSLEQRGAWD